MSEKRFVGSKLENGTYVIFDRISFLNEDGDSKLLNGEEVVDLLNELSEENEHMKKQLEKIPKSIREVWLEE